MLLKMSTLFGLFVLSCGSLFAQSSQTFTGTVSDTMCGAHHMMKDATAAKCTRECVKQGSDYALVSEGKVYTLKGKSTELDKYAGENITVRGKLSGATITVESVTPPTS